MSALNTAQREILQLLSLPMNDRDLAELKTLIIEFLAKRTVEEADAAFDKKGYTADDIQAWKHEHMRKSSTAI